MILGITLGLFILCLILLGVAAIVNDYTASDVLCYLAIVAFVASIVMLIVRMFHWIYKSSKDRRSTPGSYNCC